MTTAREDAAGLASDLYAHLEWLRDSGVREVPAVPRAAPAAEPRRASPGAAQDPSEAAPAGPARSLRAAVRAAVNQEPEGRPALSRSAPASPSSGTAQQGVSSRPFGTGAVAAPALSPAPAATPRLQGAAGAAATTAPPEGAAGERAPLPAPPRALAAATPKPLEAIRAELGECQRCKLGKTRTHLVFGVGSPTAELVFVGEGPGADEDAQGVPFVGAAGQLLTKMIEAMGFQRDEVYICNVVKCRPPRNRDPEPDEIEACEPFLQAQLASLRPKVIVTLGKFAAQTLLREKTAISRLRGKWHEYCGVKLMPTFHPSYLLRQDDEAKRAEEKKKVWEDLKLVMKEFGRTPKR